MIKFFEDVYLVLKIPVLIFTVCFLITFGVIKAFDQIPGPAGPPSLPPHVYVLSVDGKFLIDPGYNILGSLLCRNGFREVGKIENKSMIECTPFKELTSAEETYQFSYPNSRVYSWRTNA
jgi:hypothetical protein